MEENLYIIWELIRDLAKSDAFVLNDHDDYECPFCGNTANLSHEFRHDDTCIVTKARALIAEKEKG